MDDVSEESLLDYFYTTGGISGKVKNADILKTYKPFIGHIDLELRAKYREEFKVIIDRIAVVKSENGEKYLFLKKKYRQLLQEHYVEHYGAPGVEKQGQGQASPARPIPATVQWDNTGVSSPSSPKREHENPPGADPKRSPQTTWCGGPSITVTQAPDQQNMEEDMKHTESPSIQTGTQDNHAGQLEEALVPCNGEEDSGSKGESEQEEECMGSMGSNTLDPLEKEWIYSAACARVPDLSQLLRQDPSLAHKKDFTSGFTALHWAAKHGKEDMATLVANAGADINTKSHGGYTPLHIAALHGHQHILNLLIKTYGAKENLRDYSGHFACHYLGVRESERPEEQSELQCQAAQVREPNRNRKLSSLFQSKKKWGSAEELAPIEEERVVPHQLMIPAFRTRKFSR